MLQWFIDSISTSAVRGWAFDTDGAAKIGIKVLLDGMVVSQKVHWLDRPDVVRVDSRACLACGFQIDLDIKNTSMLSELALIFEGFDQRNKFLVPSVKYDRYLSDVWARFQFVTRNFPTFNPTARSNKDVNPAQNSPQEMLSIANHLYKLKEAGVEGAFAEFGCFKGFSSAMLSFACKLLGIRMHIFDSFEGLPPSTGGYLSGEFKGSLDEVKENIRTFGEIGVVEFHKGYFNEVLAETKIPHLMSIWLDVDLESSATDVMSIFRMLDPRGAVFSHECASANFVNGKIIAARHPDSVIPPIIDAFRSAGAEVAGTFLCGNTGGFWRKDNGIAAARCDDVISLANHHSIPLAMSAENDEPRHHVVISGTGRAGTSFLVHLLTYLGVHTGFQTEGLELSSVERVGLEVDIRDCKAPYIIKNPWLCEYIDEVLSDPRIQIDHAIVPVREFAAAAESRAYVQEITTGSRDGKTVNGGLWGTDKSAEQESILRHRFTCLIEALARHDVPVTFLWYPRLTQDAAYLYEKLAFLLGERDFTSFAEIFDRVRRPELVHHFTSTDH